MPGVAVRDARRPRPIGGAMQFGITRHAASFGIAPRIARRASAFAAATLLLASAGLLAGCAPEPEAKPTPPTQTSTPKPSPEPEPTTPEEPEEAPWTRFTDARFPQSFELPPGWSAVELGGDADQGIFQFSIVDAQGAEQLFFATRMTGLGGACGTLPQLELVELDSVPVELPGYVAAPDGVTQLVAPRVVFRAGQVAEGVITSLALADDVPVNSCMFYNLLHTPEGLGVFADRGQVDTYDPASQRLFASMDEARAFTETAEYAQLVRILSSLHLAG